MKGKKQQIVQEQNSIFPSRNVCISYALMYNKLAVLMNKCIGQQLAATYQFKEAAKLV